MIVVRRDSRARQPFTAEPPICAALTDDGEESVAREPGPLFKVRCFGSFRVEAPKGEVSG